MRLNKFLSDAGICSRREADRRILAGRVTVNGEPAVPGSQVLDHDRVAVDGKEIHLGERKVYLAFHKPKGIVCTAEKREKNNIVDYLKYPVRIYPVGRLDKDSEGLLLLTNDGSIVNGIMRARHYHEKEYEVQIDRPVTEEFLSRMAAGVPILDTVTRPCRIWKTGARSFTIVLTQGLNRQIRRMCEALGCRVTRLRRVRIMGIRLGDLPCGAWRELTETELAGLRAAIRDAGED